VERKNKWGGKPKSPHWGGGLLVELSNKRQQSIPKRESKIGQLKQLQGPETGRKKKSTCQKGKRKEIFGSAPRLDVKKELSPRRGRKKGGPRKEKSMVSR